MYGLWGSSLQTVFAYFDRRNDQNLKIFAQNVTLQIETQSRPTSGGGYATFVWGLSHWTSLNDKWLILKYLSRRCFSRLN